MMRQNQEAEGSGAIPNEFNLSFLEVFEKNNR